MKLSIEITLNKKVGNFSLFSCKLFQLKHCCGPCFLKLVTDIKDIPNKDFKIVAGYFGCADTGLMISIERELGREWKET